MRNILTALVMSALSVASALAEASSPKKPDPAASAARPTARRAGASNPCSAFGPGFVKLEGSETCVKIGGAVGVGGGGSIGAH